MSWTFLTIFVLLSTAAVTTSEPYLEVVKNENGIETLVESVVETHSGINLALSCKILDTKGKKLTQDDVTWIKKKKDLKLTDKFVNGPRLNLTALTINDQGEYLCTSQKHKLTRTIFLVAKPERSENNLKYLAPRQKRSMSNYDQWDSEGFQSHNLNRETRNDWGLWDDQTEDKWSEAKKREEEARKKLQEKKEADARRMKHIKTAFIIVGAIVGGAVVLYILYKCMTGNDYRTARSRRIDNLIAENRQLNERITRVCAERETARNNEGSMESQLVQPPINSNLGPSPQKNVVSKKMANELPPPYEAAVADTAPSAPLCVNADNNVSHLRR